MSTTPELFEGFIDDAAVFPPGNAPLPLALARHRQHRQARYAACIGPLLVPAAAVAELRDLLDARSTSDVLRIGVIGRPGTDPTSVVEALHTAREHPLLEVAGVEMGWSSGWRDLDVDVPLALEVPRGPAQRAALDDLAEAVSGGADVLAKFRTGPTPTWAWPNEDELAALITACADDLPVKLTGGLHHAVRGTYVIDAHPQENHGVLNVLVAVWTARQHAHVEEVAHILTVREAPALARSIADWDEAAVREVRSALVSFGCCEVTDPLTELAALDLLTDPPLPTES